MFLYGISQRPAHRQRQLPKDQRHNKENVKTTKSAYKKKMSGMRVEETNYRKPGTVLKKVSVGSTWVLPLC